jgi:hypothetical protein
MDLPVAPKAVVKAEATARVRRPVVTSVPKPTVMDLPVAPKAVVKVEATARARRPVVTSVPDPKAWKAPVDPAVRVGPRPSVTSIAMATEA